MSAALRVLFVPLFYAAHVGGFVPNWVWGHLSMLRTLPIVVLYLVAAVRTKVVRWRVYFFLAFALEFLVPLSLLPAAVLVVVAVSDARQGRRYRWTHWLGVGLGLWNALMTLASTILRWSILI